MLNVTAQSHKIFDLWTALNPAGPDRFPPYWVRNENISRALLDFQIESAEARRLRNQLDTLFCDLPSYDVTVPVPITR